MLARLCVLYLVLAVMALFQVFRRGTGDGPLVLWAYSLLAAGFAFNLASALGLNRLPQRWWVAVVHIVFDALLTSLWIYWTGAKDSLFALLYLVQILVVSIVLYQKGALFTSVVACIAFGLVSATSVQSAALFGWFVYSGLFLTLGIVGGYLSEELLRTSETLKERNRNIEKLRALHERILVDLPTGLLTVDSEGIVHFMNPAAEHILGLSASKVIGKPLQSVEPGLLPFLQNIDTEKVEVADVGADETVAASGDPLHRSFFVETTSSAGRRRLQQTVEVGRGAAARLLRGDVAELESEATLSGLLDREATGGRVLLFQDVTKLLHLEEKLKQNEKLAAVGHLAAGIAHEIRNPLASMSASIEMLRGSLSGGGDQSENRKLMDIAIREIDRLNDLISDFLDFVKPEKFRAGAVDLTAVISDVTVAIRQAKNVVGRIEIVEKCDSSVVAVGNTEKLKQVMWNLLMNATQSMTKPGRIEVGCIRVTEDRVMFWVQDEGVGMGEDVLAHLYEPFFTTKDKGTGLGLATAYKIVEAHHGEIRVTSKLNSGTRFEVWLPGHATELRD